MRVGDSLVSELKTPGSTLRGAFRDVTRDALLDALRDTEFRAQLVQFVADMAKAEVEARSTAEVEQANLKKAWQKDGAKPVKNQAILKAAIAAVEAEDSAPRA